MSTLFLDPAADVSVAWSTINPSSPTTHYDKISYTTRQPTTPQTTNFVRSTRKIVTDVDEYSLGSTSLIGSGSVSQIIVWCYCSKGPLSPLLKGDIKPGGGAYIGLQDFGVSLIAGWKSITFSGLSWTQTQLNTMTLKMQVQHFSGKINSTVTQFDTYIEVTYTAGSTIVVLKYISVAQASISKVNSVSNASANKIMGVQNV